MSDDIERPTTTTTATTGLPRRKPEEFLVGGGAPIDIPADAPRRTPGRVATALVMIVALVGAGVTRHLAMSYQQKHSPTVRRTAGGGGTSLAGMDSYALALLLGGLRGPLVMVLWANSESQKADRNLEGVDTQIEWIRRLQPEFDTVHIFQMWNKAYNLSVQMVGLSNKYTTILDAVDYGRSIDAERPDNLNILKEIARTYGEKLGNSIPEKHYYRERLRRETRHREQAQGQRGEAGFQRVAHDPVLDAAGNVLPAYLAVRFPGKPYDGSDLQFLKQYEPFPYGVSPSAFGYNYNKRAQVLMTTQDQLPSQISTSVMDSQPALALKQWGEEEWERATRMEIKAFGQVLPEERVDQELPTAAVAVDAKPADASSIPEMIYSYDVVVRLAGDSIKEYERHLANPEFATKRAMYASHIDTVRAMRAMCAGDRDYLKAMQAPAGAERAKLLASARQHYRDAIREYALTAIRYFTADRFATAVLPKGVNRANIGTGPLGSATQVTDEDMLRIHTAVNEHIARAGGPDYDENADDRKEYNTYITRALERINQIDRAAGTTASVP